MMPVSANKAIQPEASATNSERTGSFSILPRKATGKPAGRSCGGCYRTLESLTLSEFQAFSPLIGADVYEAMSARRPYRDALEWEQIRDTLRNDSGKGLDPDCVRALEHWHDQCELLPRVDAQLAAVECACSPLGC